MTEYIEKAFTGLKPFWGAILAFLSYICFPDKAFFYAMMAVIGAALFDIVTKSVCICKNNGGYSNAVKTHKLFSKTLWTGTVTKIYAYSVVCILTGLSYRVIYIQEAGIVLGSFVYSVMFMREFQSNIENLVEAGADLNWLLLFSKKKNRDLMKDLEGVEEDENI
ncbi:MAG: hypothetical protein K0R54_2223 [Clostridiaceae bacterium]|jgi:hypothetical protein|nr:hypothetical protein [Clostridiaceae bacterium]